MTKVLVTGAGGFIGHHLVTFLKQQGYWVRGVDQKLPEYSQTDADEFLLARSSALGELPHRRLAGSMKSMRSRPTWAGWVSFRRITRRSCTTTR